MSTGTEVSHLSDQVISQIYASRQDTCDLLLQGPKDMWFTDEAALPNNDIKGMLYSCQLTKGN